MRRYRQYLINYNEDKVPLYTLPDPLKSEVGIRIKNKRDWVKIRRPEIISLFKKNVYGSEPDFPIKFKINNISLDQNALNGRATRKEITLLYNDSLKGPYFNILLYIPNNVKKPVPAFLGLNFKGNHTIVLDKDIKIRKQWKKPSKYSLPVHVLPPENTRGSNSGRWPMDRFLRNGYAIVTAYYGDFEPDFNGGWLYGIRSISFERYRINIGKRQEIFQKTKEDSYN